MRDSWEEQARDRLQDRVESDWSLLNDDLDDYHNELSEHCRWLANESPESDTFQSVKGRVTDILDRAMEAYIERHLDDEIQEVMAEAADYRHDQMMDERMERAA